MNAQVQQSTDIVASKTTTALAVVTQAIAEINTFEVGIAALEQKYGGLVFDVKTPKGMKEAKEARAKVREPRYALQNIEKAAKKPLNGLKDAITDQTAAMIERIAKIEDPLHEAIDNEETRIHNEAVAKATAERERVEALEARLETLQLMPFDAQGLTSVQCQACLDEARAMKIGEDWQEFAEKAERAKASVVAALEGMVAKALAAEEEAARVLRERAELEAAKAELAKRDAAERERQAAEAAKVAAEQKAEAERLAAVKAEQDKIEVERAAAAKAEQDKLDAERQALEKEKAEIAAAQAERIRVDNVNFRAHQEKLTPEQKERLADDSAANPTADVYSLAIYLPPQPARSGHGSGAMSQERFENGDAELAASAWRPTDAEIVQAICNSFGVDIDTATEWLEGFGK